jgi:hypothetical protein
MGGQGLRRGAAGWAALWLIAAAMATGCGGEEDLPAPEPRDIDTVGVAITDTVTQCGSVRRGFIAEPDLAALKRNVEALTDALDRLDPDARFRMAAGADTTLRDQVELAIGQLERDCAPEQAAALRDALPED